MRISKRLVLLLAIPLLGLLVVTGYGVVYGTSRALEASELQDRTELALVTHSLVDDLQDERNQLVSESAADPQRRERIRTAVQDLQRRLANLDDPVSVTSDEIERRFRSVDRVATMGLTGRVALRHHSLAVEQLLHVAADLSNPRGAVDDAAASTVDYLARAKAASAEERDLLIFQTQGGAIDAIAFQQLTKLGAAQQSYTALAADAAVGQAFTLRIERVGHAKNAADAAGPTGSMRSAASRTLLASRSRNSSGTRPGAMVTTSSPSITRNQYATVDARDSGPAVGSVPEPRPDADPTLIPSPSPVAAPARPWARGAAPHRP